MAKYQDLTEFVTRAEKNRKYPTGTAQSLRAALKLFAAELNEKEAADVEVFVKNFDQITRNVFQKNANNFTASSLATYRLRVLKVLSDFEKYNDPSKMNNWSPKVILRGPRKPSKSPIDTNSDSTEDASDTASQANMHRIELVLRDGVKALIKVPLDMSKKESERIKSLIDSLVADE